MSPTEAVPGATLVVRRPGSHVRDWMRRYGVTVDGESVGKLRRGGELVVPLAPGLHRVEARIDWTGSPPVDVTLRSGESAVFSVEPVGSVFRSFDQLIGRRRYLRLRRTA
ncbi:hypothetical protein [Sanguibacter suaedae]|uniref:Uncharacterized protein n=1 Tax=Sanguibacter suaedae TaxID=2795737 RepID=A0A934I9K9_9MICO|nr:hypothetical protein [Sanguibacter suaedae]MBI9115592.1 hypothetical protein [Sanguibacter suaedae]